MTSHTLEKRIDNTLARYPLFLNLSELFYLNYQSCRNIQKVQKL